MINAIEAATQALAIHWKDLHTNESLGRQRALAEHALTAALPALEQQIREQVAAEIRRECDVLSSSTVSEYVVIHVKTGLERAAQIARGEQA